MINIRFFLLFAVLFIFQNCEEKVAAPTQPLNFAQLPTTAKPVDFVVYNQNCWVEQGKFYLTGVCSNPTENWQKIWFEITPLNAAGKPITISKCSSVIVPTLSDAMPPTGRTSFSASWPVSEFSGKPDTFKIKAMMAIQPEAGPILVAPMVTGMKMMVPVVEGQPASQDAAWLVNSSISNPLPMTASKPRLEVLVFGSDNRLYMSTLLNPDDPAIKPIFHAEGEGPLMPGENRPFSLQVYYQGLPQILQEKKIGRVEILPFDARQ